MGDHWYIDPAVDMRAMYRTSTSGNFRTSSHTNHDHRTTRGMTAHQVIFDELAPLSALEHFRRYTNKEHTHMSQPIKGDKHLFEVIVVRQPEYDHDTETFGTPELLVLDNTPIRKMLFARTAEQATMEAARALPKDVELDDVAIIARKLS